jgi:anti-sigma regulatory factor (Ser/Thr protein kinase)
VRDVRFPEPLRLEPDGRSSGLARRYVRQALTDLDLLDLVDGAELGVTELVTNACLHARTPVTVTLRTSEGVLRIEVADGSPRAPEQRRYDAMATMGRGLRLLESYGRWGFDAAAPPRIGKTVWFEPAHALGEAAWAAADFEGWRD